MIFFSLKQFIDTKILGVFCHQYLFWRTIQFGELSSMVCYNYFLINMALLQDGIATRDEVEQYPEQVKKLLMRSWGWIKNV